MKYSSLVEVYEKLDATTKRLEKTKIISELFKNIDEKDIEIIVLSPRVTFEKIDNSKKLPDGIFKSNISRCVVYWNLYYLARGYNFNEI